MRLKRIPREQRCRYDAQARKYINQLTKAWLFDLERKWKQAGVSWRTEMKEALDQYLFALAFLLTSYSGGINTSLFYDEGIDFTDIEINHYLRGFYRLAIFTELFGPGVFSEPVLYAIDRVGKTYTGENPRHWYADDVEGEVVALIQELPIYSVPIKTHTVRNDDDPVRF